jgi:hypothetical protein
MLTLGWLSEAAVGGPEKPAEGLEDVAGAVVAAAAGAVVAAAAGAVVGLAAAAGAVVGAAAGAVVGWAAAAGAVVGDGVAADWQAARIDKAAPVKKL